MIVRLEDSEKVARLYTRAAYIPDFSRLRLQQILYSCPVRYRGGKPFGIVQLTKLKFLIESCSTSESKRVLVQDLIKSLCAKLLEARDENEAHIIANQLQEVIHEHIEQLRLRLLSNLGKPNDAFPGAPNAS
jgi:hypothetical protein